MCRILTIGVSARALFNLDDEHALFESQGLDVYVAHQISHEKSPLQIGPAFPFVKAMLSINTEEKTLVQVVLISGQHPNIGLRVLRRAQDSGVDIHRAAFTGGSSVIPYLQAFEVDLFLSRSAEDVQTALDFGVPSAFMSALSETYLAPEHEVIKVAFDGDSVLFSDESEAISKTQGLEAFVKNELTNVDVPMKEGPFARFLQALHYIRDIYPDKIRIALVTARSGTSIDRAVKTLRHWGIHVDEGFFLGSLPKGNFISAFKPHIFFDDQEKHIQSASPHAPSGRVPYLQNGAMRIKA